MLNDEIEPGILMEVEFERAVDGDTIEVSFTRKFNLRLRNIDTAEKKTDKGMAALDYVDNLLSNAEKIYAFIPTNDPIKLMDINSFERIVGDLIVDGNQLYKKLGRFRK